MTDDVQFPTDALADVMAANRVYTERFQDDGRPGTAAKGLAILTCMDSRIDPLAVVGMTRGDAKILRNAGGRATQDVLRTLVLATYLLDVRRILVMPHTDCAMASGTEEQIHQKIMAASGVDTHSLEFLTTLDQEASLAEDLRRIRTDLYLPTDVVVAGAIYDVRTGRLTPKDL